MTVTADVRTVENVIGGKERAASGGGTFEKLAPADRRADQPGRALGRRRRRRRDRRGRGGAAGLGGQAGRGARPHSAPDRAAARARPGTGRGGRLRRDRQVAEGCEGRDRRRDRARLLHRRRRAALLRQDDAERDPEPQAMTIRQPLGVAGPDHRREHADRERRLEGLPGAPLRERGGAEGLRGRAGDGASSSLGWRRRRASRPAC